ncbi:MAG: alpha/beta hydrolase [Alphaproteobacteria bacterium]|nr:MAG: alpha/beta hydrolase [Alphaproteobacteria bacterium]
MHRPTVLEAAAIGGLGAAPSASAAATESGSRQSLRGRRRPHYVSASDGTKLFVQDWGSGRSIVLLSPWTLNSDIWGTHIAALTARGFRCVAPDRRGHGRSEVPTGGYDLDTLADDVASAIEQLDLQQVILVAYSMGASEAVKYLERHGSSRISRLVLCAPGTPFLLKTEDNPDGIPPAAAEALVKAIAHDFPKWIADNEAPFFTPDTITETRSWIKSMMMSVPLPIVLATLIAPDLRSAVGKINLPTLIVQGDNDASNPLPITGAKTARLIANCRLVVVEGAPHALVLTHRERFLSELLGFIGS